MVETTKADAARWFSTGQVGRREGGNETKEGWRWAMAFRSVRGAIAKSRAQSKFETELGS